MKTTHSAGPDSQRTSAIASVACGLLALFLAFIYMAARAGFGYSASGVAGALGLSWCVTSLPVAWLSMRSGGSGSWAVSEGFLTLVLIAVTAFVGYWALEFGFSASAILFIAGLLALARNAMVARTSHVRPFFWFAATILVYAVWVAGVEWANGYLSPLYVENLILHGGEGHYDTLFLTSLGNMINTYGVPTTGWDGIPYTPYHFGSSWLFAQWANLTNLSVLDFYLLGVPLVVIPLLLRALFTMGTEVRAFFAVSDTEAPVTRYATMAFLIACATIGFLPPNVLQSAGVWKDGPFLSESHVLGLGLTLFTLSVITHFARNQMTGGLSARFSSAAPFLLFVVPVSIAAIGVTKVSHMILLVALMLFFVLRLRLFRRPIYLSGALLLSAIAVVVYRYVVWSGLNQGITFFSFLRTFIPPTWWTGFWILHLFWTWLYAWLRLKQEGAQTLADVRALFAARRVVDVEGVLLIGILAVLPGIFFNLRSDAYYFSDVQRWIALSAVLGNSYLLEKIWSGKSWSLSGVFARRRPHSLRLDQLVVAVLAIFVVTTMLLTAVSWGGSLVRSNMNTRRELQDIAGNRPGNSLRNEIVALVKHPGAGQVKKIIAAQLHPLADGPAFAKALHTPERQAVVYSLLGINQLPVKERRQSLIYVDPGVNEYWKFLGTRGACEFSAMIGPTLAATAMLDAIPPGCKLSGFYGESAYAVQVGAAKQQFDSAAVCAKAAQRGFGQVIALRPEANGRISSSRISCTRTAAGTPSG